MFIESCTMFTRGGVYRVVKQAMGGTLGKLSVSALMFDYILTGPISAVSAGQYLVGLIGSLLALTPLNFHLSAETHPELVRLLAMIIAIGITLYFWRLNIIGIPESSHKALRIMQLTTVMGVAVIGWSVITLILRPELRHLPPMRPVLTPESQGWLEHFPTIVGAIGVLIAFGHSLLAMSGEESMAQVYREIEAPKVTNLKRAGLVIFLYSLLLTGVVTFLAILIIPDEQRIQTSVVQDGAPTEVTNVRQTADGSRIATLADGRTFTLSPEARVERQSGRYTDNLISGLVMNLSGSRAWKLAFQAFVVLVGFLILSGAVNTSIIGSNGVLNRLAEDGILTSWFLHPQHRFGTTHRLIHIVCALQILTIIASMGNIYTLGEAYAFGVIWSFVFKTLAMVVLRFKDKSPREYEVPGNIRIPLRARADRGTPQRLDLPIGITAIFLVLGSTALVNLFTKKIATIWGIGFTLVFLAVFVACEHISRRLRKQKGYEHLEQFNQQLTTTPTTLALGLVHPQPVLVAVRNPRSMSVLERVLEQVDTMQRDIVAITCKVLPAKTPGITPEETQLDDNDRAVLTRVVNVAEEAGKTVHPLMIPTNNPMYAIACAARDLAARDLVMGTSEKTSADLQIEQFAVAWGMATAERGGSQPLRIRIVGSGANDVEVEL